MLYAAKVLKVSGRINTFLVKDAGLYGFYLAGINAVQNSLLLPSCLLMVMVTHLKPA